jgi:hypothetical protein
MPQLLLRRHPRFSWARRVWQIVVSDRYLFLFLLGPALGVFLVNAIFGMPRFLWIAAGGVTVLTFLLIGLLLVQELRIWVSSRK